MQYIKHIASLALALSILSACSFVPTNQSTPSTTKKQNLPETRAANESVSENTNQAPLSVNPYLSHKPNNIPNSAQTRFDAAVKLLKNNQLTAAESQFASLAQDHPKLSGPWLNLGLIHQRTERPESAQANFQRAIAANKTNLNAYNQLGILLREQGKFSEAEQQYLKALNVWPEHPPSHRNLGILYDLYLGRLEEALEHYTVAQTLEPKRPVRGWIADIKRRIAAANSTASK